MQLLNSCATHKGSIAIWPSQPTVPFQKVFFLMWVSQLFIGGDCTGDDIRRFDHYSGRVRGRRKYQNWRSFSPLVALSLLSTKVYMFTIVKKIVLAELSQRVGTMLLARTNKIDPPRCDWSNYNHNIRTNLVGSNPSMPLKSAETKNHPPENNTKVFIKIYSSKSQC